jgi:GTPase SAR1 family protein
MEWHKPFVYSRRLTHNTYLQEVFLQEEQPFLRSYEKEQQLLGITREGEEFYIDTSRPQKIIFLGMSGSGKTWNLRRLLSTLHLSKYQIAVIPDVKDEFKYSREPLQEKYHHLLPEGERPHTLPMKVYRPNFFGDLPEGNEFTGIPFSSLTLNDLFTLLNIKPSEEPIKAFVLEHIANAIATKDIEDFPSLYDFIERRIKNIQRSTKMSLLFRFKSLEMKNIFSEQSADLESDFAERNIVVLNISGYERFGQKEGLPHVAVAIWLRKIIDLKQQGKIKDRLFIFIDELARFCPANSEPSSKFIITEAVDVTRGFGIDFVFGAQSTSNIAPNIIPQCRYIFVPKNTPVPDLINVFDYSGVQPELSYIQKGEFGLEEKRLSWTPFSKKKIATEIKKMMNEHDWLCIDRESMTYTIFHPFPPLTHHPEIVS